MEGGDGSRFKCRCVMGTGNWDPDVGTNESWGLEVCEKDRVVGTYDLYAHGFSHRRRQGPRAGVGESGMIQDDEFEFGAVRYEMGCTGEVKG